MQYIAKRILLALSSFINELPLNVVDIPPRIGRWGMGKTDIVIYYHKNELTFWLHVNACF
ncbi:hypothetical protein [Pelosinus sp. IPA-1]|uniref:hypothetical protein n=1 Tax=Pelosinus sp. IPA-1 TaxID=3029569 RepID=UPI00243619B6|nr:hypothetical protein [Pelosinus sp. IPA-1]GMB00826.1 hypothetical protein PIPA1_36250 [Pelosinus sp. IPA-1]